MKGATPRKKKKLIGVELMRGIAVFAVVLSHSGDGSWGEISQSVIRLRTFFSFHVPFFLAISFYFLARKYFQPQQLLSAPELKARVQRIAIPYFVWSAIYMLVRTLFFFAEGNVERLAKLYGDAPSIVFLGGASYHLYFLPLLLLGTILFYCLKRSVKTWRLSVIWILFGVSCLSSMAILMTGNQFQLGPNIAFQSVFDYLNMEPRENIFLRLLAVLITWVPLCLAYISIALLFNYMDCNRNSKNDRAKEAFSSSPYVFLGAAISVFLIATFWGGSYIWLRPIQKITVAFSLVVIAFSFSTIFTKEDSFLGKISISLGKCTLGIYLVHPIVLQFAQLGISTVYPGLLEQVSVLSIIVLSSTGFFISWALIFVLSKKAHLRRYVM